MAASVYILECADGTLYTGWTSDPARRLEEHNTSDKGARYTRSRRPCKLVYVEECADRRAAMSREWQIKNRMSRAQKEALIRGAQAAKSVDKPSSHGYT